MSPAICLLGTVLDGDQELPLWDLIPSNQLGQLIVTGAGET